MSAFELALTSLEQNGGAFSRSSLAALDRTDSYPADACRALDELGLHRYYVPVEHGGKLASHASAKQLIRAVASRDLTVAATHSKTYLGTICVWLDGNPEQMSFLAGHVLSGGRVACGLTEREHGSDLLATELSAVPAGDGWRLDGEKWLINSATRAELICILARTNPAGGLRGYSLFLVDKRELAPGSWRCLPKVHTYGIRGADVSGIGFSGAMIPSSALIGRVGSGLPTVIKGLQLTRTGCAAMSLGAADHAVALAREFLDAQRSAGLDLRGFAHVRRRLGRNAARVLVAEAAATLATRSVQALPEEMTVISAIAKAFVPTTIDGLLADLSRLLGPYGILSDAFADGSFVKLERDNRIIAIFDGSAPVNRAMLVAHLPKLASGYGETWDRAGLEAAAALDTHLGLFDTARLRLTSGCSSVVAALPATIAELKPSLPAGLHRLASMLETATSRLHHEMLGYRHVARNIPVSAFAMAERYELCFAGAASLHIRRFSPDSSPGDLTLRACLVYVLELLGERLTDEDLGVYERLEATAFAPETALSGSSATHAD